MRDRPKSGTIRLVYSHGGCRLSKKTYDKAFINRVRVARESSGITRDEMAELLKVRYDTYARWELRTMMPHHMIPAFCRITGVSLKYLMGATDGKKKTHLKSV